MKILYILLIAVVAGFHLYIGWKNDTSPLNFNLILLLLIPFLTIAWKDASSIKFGAKGIELEKLKKDVDKTIKDAVHSKHIDRKSLETLFKSAQANDWLKLVLTRMLMRKGLTSLLPNHGFGKNPSLKNLIDLYIEEKNITEKEELDLKKLRNITYYAEWWAGDTPTHSDWKWALDNCEKIIKNMFDKQLIA
jgi:hypothetical protein